MRFVYEKGKYEFVKTKNIISCWDEKTCCKLKYATDGNNFNVNVVGYTVKEVLKKLTGKKVGE